MVSADASILSAGESLFAEGTPPTG